MKFSFIPSGIFMLTVLLSSCGGGDADTANNQRAENEPTAERERVFKGKMDCAGCEGLFSELTIRQRSDLSTYILKETYNNGDAGMQTVNDSGTLQVLYNEAEFANDSVYWMKAGSNVGERYYRQVSPDTLLLVDAKGNPATGSGPQYLVIRR